MGPTAIAVSTEGKKKPVYTQAQAVLAHLLEDEIDSVEYLDDVDWKAYPQVGAALKQIATAEECFTIAVCPAHGVWALGVGMRSANRFNAAKIALATSLAISRQESGEEIDLSGFQTFQDFVDEAYSALDLA